MEQDDRVNILNDVNKIENEVKNLTKQKEEIQSACAHNSNTYLAFNESNVVKKYCSICKRDLAFATKEEQDTFLGEQK